MPQALIDDEADICTLINTFDVAPQRQAAVVDALRRFTLQHAQTSPGFVGASVHASLDGHHVANYVQWKTRGHLTAMLQTEPAKVHMAEVAALADMVRPVFYRVAFVDVDPA